MNEIQDTITNSPEGRYTCSSTGVRRLTMSTCDENVKKNISRQNIKSLLSKRFRLCCGYFEDRLVLYFTFKYDVTK